MEFNARDYVLTIKVPIRYRIGEGMRSLTRNPLIKDMEAIPKNLRLDGVHHKRMILRFKYDTWSHLEETHGDTRVLVFVYNDGRYGVVHDEHIHVMRFEVEPHGIYVDYDYELFDPIIDSFYTHKVEDLILESIDDKDGMYLVKMTSGPSYVLSPMLMDMLIDGLMDNRSITVGRWSIIHDSPYDYSVVDLNVMDEDTSRNIKTVSEDGEAQIYFRYHINDRYHRHVWAKLDTGSRYRFINYDYIDSLDSSVSLESLEIGGLKDLEGDWQEVSQGPDVDTLVTQLKKMAP